MENKEIIEGNKLIAEFMGMEFHTINNITGVTIDGVLGGLEKLQYHTSWDWLMPVVEKINLDRRVEEVSISMGKTRIWFKRELMKPYIQYPVNPHYDTITQCFLTAVEFIKWYNENKNN